jgi:hypothetical protein
MKTISLKLPEKLIAAVEAESRFRSITKSAYIRDALEKSLAGRKTKRVSGYDLIKDLVGAAKNAPRDLATNPKYMEGYGR